MKYAILSLIAAATLLNCSTAEQVLAPEPDVVETKSEISPQTTTTSGGTEGDIIFQDAETIYLPMPSPVIHPCTGEPVALVGTMIIKNKVTVTETGFRTVMLLDARSIRGRGLLSGKEYYNEEHQTHELANFGTFFEEVRIIKVLFIRIGETWALPKDDFFSNVTIHIQIKDGVMTANVVKIKEECK